MNKKIDKITKACTNKRTIEAYQRYKKREEIIETCNLFNEVLQPGDR